MNKIKLMVATFGVIAISVASVAVLTNKASAATTCIVSKATGFTVNADKTATGSFTVTGEPNCTVPVSVMTWNANPGPTLSDDIYNNAEFYTSQTMYDVKTQSFGVGTHTMTVKLPVCETDPNVVRGYQADVVMGADPATFITAPGTPGYYWELQANGSSRVVDWKIGTHNCPAAPEKSTTTDITSNNLGKPTELANTGPGSAIAVAIATTIASIAGYGVVMRKRLARS